MSVSLVNARVLLENGSVEKTEILIEDGKIRAIGSGAATGHAVDLDERLVLPGIIDLHGEITSEKMALGHFLDGKVTTVVGTHTHVPTSDTKILKKGTAYQTDLGMCGDYDSVIGMNKYNSIKKFKKDPSAENHFPANGDASLSGVIVDADDETGLAISINQIIFGGNLKQKF